MENKVQAVQGKRKGKKLLASVGLAMGAMAALASGASAAPLDFSGQSLGIDVNDVIGTGFSFMGMFDQYTLLVLGAIFAPIIIGFVFMIMKRIPRFGGGKR